MSKFPSIDKLNLPKDLEGPPIDYSKRIGRLAEHPKDLDDRMPAASTMTNQQRNLLLAYCIKSTPRFKLRGYCEHLGLNIDEILEWAEDQCQPC